MARAFVLLLAAFTAGQAVAAPAVPAAIYTDPLRDAAHPARMEVLHVPSGGVEINGVAYLAAGSGPHPTLVICHGLPGNEKNLDLAQAVRRAGWNAITFNYRGSWGSPGSFRFAQNPRDAAAVLAYLRDPANAKVLGVDTRRIVVAGHSMGGWAAVEAAAADRNVAGVVTISTANMGRNVAGPRADVVKTMSENMEALAGVTAESMADELIAGAATNDFIKAAPALARTPMLVLTSDDGLAPASDALVAAVRAAGGKQVATLHVATDHGWSDQRIRLQSEVIRWLGTIR